MRAGRKHKILKVIVGIVCIILAIIFILLYFFHSWLMAFFSIKRVFDMDNASIYVKFAVYDDFPIDDMYKSMLSMLDSDSDGIYEGEIYGVRDNKKIGLSCYLEDDEEETTRIFCGEDKLLVNIRLLYDKIVNTVNEKNEKKLELPSWIEYGLMIRSYYDSHGIIDKLFKKNTNKSGIDKLTDIHQWKEIKEQKSEYFDKDLSDMLFFQYNSEYISDDYTLIIGTVKFARGKDMIPIYLRMEYKENNSVLELYGKVSETEGAKIDLPTDIINK